jgi:hypothetical protein
MTSNARPRTRSAHSRRNGVYELLANYLFIQLQKAKNHTLFVSFFKVHLDVLVQHLEQEKVGFVEPLCRKVEEWSNLPLF